MSEENTPRPTLPAKGSARKLNPGWPERFYILDENGTIVFKGRTGPFGFHPEEVEDWLKRRFSS